MIARRVSNRVHYAWIIAAVTFLILIFSAGFRSTPSILMVPLQREFGWDRASISLAVAINLVLYGLSGPFAAALMLRFGIKKVTVTALVTIAMAAALTTQMRTTWQLILLWGVVIGIATGSLASVLAATIANRWFVRRRGLVMGVLSASNATGQIGFLPFLAVLATVAGWRVVSLAVASVALLIVPIVVLLMKNRPEDVGLMAYGSMEVSPPPATSRSPIAVSFHGLRLGVRSGSFWLLAGSFFVCGASTNGLIGTHLIPAAMDHGIPEVTAASLLATVGFFDIFGTVASGWLTDRWNSRRLLCWYYGLRGLSLFLLPSALHSTGLLLLIFVVFYGLDWVATVPPTAALATEIFGREMGGIVYGWVFASHQLGAAFAAYGAGLIRTSTGSYLLAFLAAGALCLLAAAGVLTIPSVKRRQLVPPEPTAALA